MRLLIASGKFGNACLSKQGNNNYTLQWSCMKQYTKLHDAYAEFRHVKQIINNDTVNMIQLYRCIIDLHINGLNASVQRQYETFKLLHPDERTWETDKDARMALRAVYERVLRLKRDV